MKPVIIGTAGHIDHGKTALVKALTGIDADRLAEEKRRGITIDLGFAHMDLAASGGETLRLGFVDVPGHERFVRNMLAGAGGIDLVLFVVAADESVKPQTREHFEICRMLGISRGVVVLTKADLVNAETVEVVKAELAPLFAGSFLDLGKTHCVPVSSRTGAGIEALKLSIAATAATVTAKSADALLRLPIDRSFTMKGFGAVVTGTLIAGSIAVDQELEALPAGKKLRVRGIQVHGAATGRAVAGERTALNLAGASLGELARGTVLVAPNTVRATRRLDVRLHLLREARALRDRARVHLHAFTSECVAEVHLLEGQELKPGESGLAQLRAAGALVLSPGDRFIIRQFSPVVTIGGGVVLDNAPAKRKAGAAAQAAKWLQELEAAGPAKAFEMRVARREQRGLNLADAIAETGWTAKHLDLLAAEPAQRESIERIGDLFLSRASLAAAGQQLLRLLAEFHKANPLVPGMGKKELRERLDLSPAAFQHLLASLTAGKKVEVVGEVLRAAGQGVQLSPDEERARSTIVSAFATAGLKVPSVREVLAALPVDAARSQKIVTLLLRDKVLVKVADDLVFHGDSLLQLRKLVAEQKKKSPRIDVAGFKELTGVTRKYAIPLLEYLDRERVTRRVGDAREIL